NYVIYLQPHTPHDPKYYTEGVSIALTERHRNSKRALDPNIKSGNYLNNVMAFTEGKKFNAYESVFINPQGQITECTTSNIFIVKGNEIISPPDESDILRGITRDILKDICRENDIRLSFRHFNVQELVGADEVFITSSTREIMPVSVVNGQKRWSPGPVVDRLNTLYKKEILKYLEWAKSHHPWK
ncbi:MAG: aminotransferase class IV family protein, partial [Bdellovibrionales bacterium]|nr:aminotransferase class IV family protein [Bdellovibrionales bacterium]